MTGDLPQLREGCTAVQLSFNTVIVIGGRDNQNKYNQDCLHRNCHCLQQYSVLLSSFDYPDIVCIETSHFCTFPLVISFTILTILTQHLMYETEEVVCLCNLQEGCPEVKYELYGALYTCTHTHTYTHTQD